MCVRALVRERDIEREFENGEKEDDDDPVVHGGIVDYDECNPSAIRWIES